MLNLRMTERDCPICGPRGNGTVFAETNVDPQRLDSYAFASRKTPEYMHWRLLECSACDLLYASPAPAPEDLGALYQSAAFASTTEAGYASTTYARLLARLTGALSDREGALDIGTGDGAFLSKLTGLGFAGVVGIEPSSAPIAAAAADVRPLIRQEMFRPGLFPDNSFALVTCFQTIEHVPDPLALCRDIHRVLKPGGMVFLIGHNRRALSAKVLGRKSPIFDIEHLQLFSPASAKKLLHAAGFATVEVLSVYNRYPLAYWLRLFPFPRRLKTAVISAANFLRVGRLELGLPAGNLAAFARKTSGT